jgi:hypothetical protein
MSDEPRPDEVHSKGTFLITGLVLGLVIVVWVYTYLVLLGR